MCEVSEAAPIHWWLIGFRINEQRHDADSSRHSGSIALGTGGFFRQSKAHLQSVLPTSFDSDRSVVGQFVFGLHREKQCDRYAARPYNHKVCCRAARRDPRIPGPRIVSTLPAHPEMAAPGYFQPVPTYAVFGPRSEQPDGIEPQMQPLMPDEPSGLEGEPLPMPTRQDTGEAGDAAVEDDEPAEGPSALNTSSWRLAV